MNPLTKWLLALAWAGAACCFFLQGRKKQKAAEGEFTAVVGYMEQVLYLFRRQPKLAAALNMVEGTVEPAALPLVRGLRRRLTDPKDPEPYRSAIDWLEKTWQLRELTELHRFFRKIEQTGGEFKDGLDLLLAEIRSWSEQEELYRQQREQLRRHFTLCILLSMAVSILAVRIIPFDLWSGGSRAYRVWTVLVFLGYLGLFAAARLSGNGPWGREEAFCSEEQIAKERGYLKGSPLRLHRRRLAIKRLRREAGRCFPLWLREMSVNLQSQTVQTALRSLLPEAPPIIRVYLKETLEKIGRDPLSVAPYREFMEELDLPKVRDAMVLLYALNGTGRQYAREQLESLTRKNRLLYEAEQARRREDLVASLGLLAALPMGLAVLKLLTDMGLTLFGFLKGMGQYVA